jgi:hypothetical protein
MKRHSAASVLERLLDPVSRSLNDEAARKLIRIKADAESQARVDELAQKCNEGDMAQKSARNMSALSRLATSSQSCKRRRDCGLRSRMNEAITS